MDALLVVDVQNDFAPWGALPVPRGDEVVPVANRLIPQFELVVATKDWHPPDHGSFASQHPGRKPFDVIDLAGLEQILWPDHCVQGTPGAEFIAGLQTDSIDRVFYKGIDRQVDSYSGFFDNARRRSTGLDRYLAERSVDRIFIAGLATDYCVKFTALDARSLGLDTHVVLDGCRGIDAQPGDVDAALDEMRRAGVQIVRSDDLH